MLAAAATPVADEWEVEVIDDDVIMIDSPLLVQPQDQPPESDSQSRYWTADEKELLFNWVSKGLQKYQLWKNQMEKASERVSKVIFQG